MTRPPFDQWAMSIAFQVAERSTCLSQKVGAIVVRDREIIATGYNGTPSGEDHCIDIGKCVNGESECKGSVVPSPAVHAEMNAIAQAAKHGHVTNGATLYCTHPPCQNCSKLIKAAGIVRVVTPELLEVK